MFMMLVMLGQASPVTADKKVKKISPQAEAGGQGQRKWTV